MTTLRTFIFAVLTPAFIAGAKEKNEAIFASGNVLGIEVSIPALAAKCDLGNIDPQHSGGDIGTAAIEAAMAWPLPADGATLFTVRADLDSVGAMAVLKARAEGIDLTPAAERLRIVGDTDRFGSSKWPGQAPLPSPANRWPSLIGTLDSGRPTAVMQAVCLDAKLPLEKRVELVLNWLLTGDEPVEYVDRVERGRDAMIAALESGEIKVRLEAGGVIAVVESRHVAALLAGYCRAPVVVALNDRFSVGGSAPHAKATICQYGGGGYVDLAQVFTDLNVREFGEPRPKNGWGGSPTVGGSPQGVSTTISLDEIVAVVEKHLKG